jgi:heptosyltransferase-2
MTYGDFVLTIPFFRLLKRRYPESHVTLLCGQRGRVFSGLYPWVDELINLEDLKSASAFVHTLRRLLALLGSEFVFALHPMFSAALLAFLLAGRRRIGFSQAHVPLFIGTPGLIALPSASPTQRWLIEHLLLTESREMVVGERHASTHFNQLLPGPDASAEWLRGSLRGVFPRSSPAPQKLVILAPFSGWTARNWPLERWVQLAAQLLAADPITQLLVSCEATTRDAATAAFRAFPAVRIFCPGEDFRLLFRTFADAALVVSNDSFPLHMASALDVPAVGLFGPNLPQWFGALSARSRNLHPPIECSPCRQHRGDTPCLMNLRTCAALSALTVETVTRECLALLGQDNP